MTRSYLITVPPVGHWYHSNIGAQQLSSGTALVTSLGESTMSKWALNKPLEQEWGMPKSIYYSLLSSLMISILWLFYLFVTYVTHLIITSLFHLLYPNHWLHSFELKFNTIQNILICKRNNSGSKTFIFSKWTYKEIQRSLHWSIMSSLLAKWLKNENQEEKKDIL